MPALAYRDRRQLGREPLEAHVADGRDDGPIVIVVPRSARASAGWRAGGGNYHFELIASAEELFGEERVVEFLVDDGEEAAYDELGAFVVSERASHCVAFIESDPGLPGQWHWQRFAQAVAGRWGGSLVGVLTDGVYLLHQARAARLRRTIPRSVFVAIDMDRTPHASYLPGDCMYGPCFLPISSRSQEALAPSGDVISAERPHDIVFVGKVYANREAFLERLSASGLRVGVNPHVTTPQQRPGYADYVNGLRSGYFTVNLAMAGGMRIMQLKSRILEAPLFGTMVCSDETDLGAMWFAREQMVRFSSAEDLAKSVEQRLARPDDYRRTLSRAHDRARAIAARSLWDTADAGLRSCGLPPLGR